MLQMKIAYFLLTSCLLHFPLIGFALIAYDCTQSASSLTTFSLLHVGECDIKKPMVNSTRTFVKLLQLNEFTNHHVRLCKIVIKRKVEDCGWYSTWTDVQGGEAKYIDDVTADQCEIMHRMLTHKVRDQILLDLKLNGTVIYPMTFAGSVSRKGNCNS